MSHNTAYASTATVTGSDGVSYKHGDIFVEKKNTDTGFTTNCTSPQCYIGCTCKNDGDTSATTDHWYNATRYAALYGSTTGAVTVQSPRTYAKGYTGTATTAAKVTCYANKCNYEYFKVTPSHTCGGSNQTCLKNLIDSGTVKSVEYVQTGSSSYAFYNKISPTSKTCTDGSGTTKYETICSGTKQANCCSAKVFTPTCTSESYVSGGSITIGSATWGTCGACNTANGYYSSEATCKTHFTTGLDQKCVGTCSNACYQVVTCNNSQGLYTTYDKCEAAMPNSTLYTCQSSGQCYKLEKKPYFTLSIPHCLYGTCCSRSISAVFQLYKIDNNGNTGSKLADLGSGGWESSDEIPQGTYRFVVCVSDGNGVNSTYGSFNWSKVYIQDYETRAYSLSEFSTYGTNCVYKDIAFNRSGVTNYVVRRFDGATCTYPSGNGISGCTNTSVSWATCPTCSSSSGLYDTEPECETATGSTCTRDSGTGCWKSSTCTYSYYKATLSETCGNANTSCFATSIDRGFASATYKGSTFYNKISSTSDTCTAPNGTTKYQTLCTGTLKYNCSTDRIFTKNCSSVSYFTYSSTSLRIPVNAADFGTCGACNQTTNHFDTEASCKAKGNSLTGIQEYKCTLSSASNCYHLQTCPTGRYFTKEACEANNTNPNYTCQMVDGCFVAKGQYFTVSNLAPQHGICQCTQIGGGNTTTNTVGPFINMVPSSGGHTIVYRGESVELTPGKYKFIVCGGNSSSPYMTWQSFTVNGESYCRAGGTSTCSKIVYSDGNGCEYFERTFASKESVSLQSVYNVGCNCVSTGYTPTYIPVND